MIAKDELIKVSNRSGGSVGYSIPDLGLHRTFQAGEVKDITMDELRKLSYVPGGNTIISEYLVIDNKDAIAELLGGVEPEYFYTEDDIKKLLTEGSMDQFLDTLDFASEGVLELIKDLAVKLKISDINKRDAIKEKLGFDVTKAIEINKETNEGKSSEKSTTRRTTPINDKEEKTPRRRVVE